jgi:hypothetical protein
MLKKSEQELAHELDAFLKATIQGRPAIPSADLPPETIDFAKSLISLSQGIEPDPAFLAKLEKEITQHARRIPAAQPLSFSAKLNNLLRSITMKRPLMALGGLAALFLIAFVAWQLFSGSLETGPEEVAVGAPDANSNMTPTPAIGALPTLPHISIEGGMGGGGGGAGGGIGTLVTSTTGDMPIDLMPLPYTSIFSGTTFALNTTLPAEPTSANVLESPSTTLDLAQAQQLATRFGFTGPLYLQTYPVNETEPLPESTEPLPEPPPTYIAFDGPRQFSVYFGGASYYDSSITPDFNNPLPYEQALPIAEAFLRDRGLLDFPYVTQHGYGSMVLFYRQIDGHTLNYPELTVEIAHDGRVYTAGYQVMSNLHPLATYPLQTAAAAWQMLQTGAANNQIPFFTYPGQQGITPEQPVDDGTYQYWQRTRQPGEEAHFYNMPVVYLPADGNGPPHVFINNVQLQATDADLQAIAEQRNSNLHLWGQIGADGRTLTVAGWEPITELAYLQVNGTLERTADQLLIHASDQTYLLPNAPADLPNGLQVDVFAFATRDAGLPYPILEWDGVSKFVPLEPVVEGTVAPAEGGGFIDPILIEPFTYGQVTVNTVELAYFYMPVWQEQQANIYALPRVLLQPAWKFTGTADNGDTIEFFVPAVAPQYLQTPTN